MSAVEDRPTIGERYSSAMESSNLKLETEKRGDVDLMIAAGWVPDTLGAQLYRLAVEFDAVRTSIHTGKTLTPMSRYEILSRMRSLVPATLALGRHACVQATKRKFMQPDEVVLKVTGRVLDVWLDGLCSPCEGRGFTGGGRHEQSGPQILCRACKGTGHRRHNLGKTPAEVEFAGFLLADMQERMTGVETMMRRFLRSI